MADLPAVKRCEKKKKPWHRTQPLLSQHKSTAKPAHQHFLPSRASPASVSTLAGTWLPHSRAHPPASLTATALKASFAYHSWATVSPGPARDHCTRHRRPRHGTGAQLKEGVPTGAFSDLPSSGLWTPAQCSIDTSADLDLHRLEHCAGNWTAAEQDPCTVSTARCPRSGIRSRGTLPRHGGRCIQALATRHRHREVKHSKGRWQGAPPRPGQLRLRA